LFDVNKYDTYGKLDKQKEDMDYEMISSSVYRVKGIFLDIEAELTSDTCKKQ